MKSIRCGIYVHTTQQTQHITVARKQQMTDYSHYDYLNVMCVHGYLKELDDPTTCS